MKKITLLFFLFTLALNGYAQQFITRWDLSIAGSGATQISFGVGTSGIVNYSWETIPASVTGSGTFNGSTATITSLPAGSVVRLKIDSTNFNHFKMYNGTDRNRLIDIEQWGNIHWSNFSNSFYGCSNLNISAIDIPDLSNVPSLIWCFRGCTSLTGPTNISNWDVSHVAYMYGVFWDASIFNQPIGNWDVSHVITMNDMFHGASFFNQPIGNWDVSHVIEMADMFNGAATFNQPIGNWDVSQVTVTGYMFDGASSFNQPIGNWDVSHVTYMFAMFRYASQFNQPIGNWDVSHVTNMSSMFHLASSFNQPIGNWDVSNVTDMHYMFLGASSFNQPIGNWNVGNVSFMYGMFWSASSFNQQIGSWNVSNVSHMFWMFRNASSFNQPLGAWNLNPSVQIVGLLSFSGMDCSNYGSTLSAWAVNPNLPNGKSLGADSLSYGVNTIPYRNFLINSKGWTITGDVVDSINCFCIPTIDTEIVNTCIPYTWLNGVTYITGNHTAMYTFSGSTSTGCDSIITLNLTINNSTSNTTISTACDSYTWSLNGTIYTSTGIYTFTSLNASGCTHTDSLNLTIYNSTSNSTTSTACDFYTWPLNGITYTSSGVYTFTSLNASGCTHADSLNLTINNSTSNITSSTACDFYTWPLNGTTYTSSGIYTFTSLNASGCIHTDSLNLTINNSTSYSTTFTACDSYTWLLNGITYTSSGVYTFTSLNASGCLHIDSLNLIINNSTSYSTTFTACGSYTWLLNGITYTSSGVYTFTSLNASGCTHADSLNLTINNSTSNTTISTACDSYTWPLNGTTYTSSGIYTFTSLNTSGCIQDEFLNLTINSTDTSINNFSPLLIANASPASYQWMNCNGSIISGATNQNFIATVNGNYALIVTQNSCVDTSACITVSNVGISENSFLYEVSIYPNPTSTEITIEYDCKSVGEFVLYNMLGQQVFNFELPEASNKVHRNLPNLAKGFYNYQCNFKGCNSVFGKLLIE